MYPHRIRLRGPWECEPVAHVPETNLPLSPARRMTLPGRWNEGGLDNFAGRVRFRRRFGYPGQIDSFERVWLTFAGVDGLAEVCLNDHFLGKRDGKDGPFEFDVTDLLQTRNVLVVEVESSVNGGLWGEVALEVRCTAYLRAVQAWLQSGRLHLTGEVVGTCERALDLYALLNGSTVIQSQQEADPAGQSFHLQSQELSRDRLTESVSSIKVDLVNGAVVWYTLELPLQLREP